MKHVILPVILAVTLPAWAAEQKANPPAQQPPAAQEDSPLVAAAKRAGRLNKKPGFVITNDTLAQMNGGRTLTTTSRQPDIVMPAPLPPIEPTPEMKAAAQAAKEREARAKMDEQKKKVQQERMSKAQQRASQYEDESYLDDDPAAAEHALETMTKQPAQTTTNQQKPPQD